MKKLFSIVLSLTIFSTFLFSSMIYANPQTVYTNSISSHELRCIVQKNLDLKEQICKLEKKSNRRAVVHLAGGAFVGATGTGIGCALAGGAFGLGFAGPVGAIVGGIIGGIGGSIFGLFSGASEATKGQKSTDFKEINAVAEESLSNYQREIDHINDQIVNIISNGNTTDGIDPETIIGN